MTQATKAHSADLTRHAADAVRRFEQSNYDEPYAADLAAAEAAVAALRDAASAELFPRTLTPVSHATLVDFADCIDAVATNLLTYPRDLVRLHAAAVEHSELAAAIRGPRGRWRLENALRATHGVTGQSEAEAVRRGVMEFQQAIAQQLAARGEMVPWSAVFVRDVPELQQRVTTALQARQAHAASVMEAAQAESDAAERVLAASRLDYRQSLADRARNLPVAVVVANEFLAGTALVRRIEVADESKLPAFEAAIAAVEASLGRP
jgi:hypothetical protein